MDCFKGIVIHFNRVSFGVHVPLWLYNYEVNSFINLSPLALSIIILCTLVLLFGIKESARVNLVMTIINVVLLVFLIILGAFHVNPSNLTPFMPFGFQGALKYNLDFDSQITGESVLSSSHTLDLIVCRLLQEKSKSPLEICQ